MTLATTKKLPKLFLHFVVIVLFAMLTVEGCVSLTTESPQTQSTSLPQPSVFVEVDDDGVYLVDAYVEDTILTGDTIIHPDTVSDTFLKVSISKHGGTALKQQDIRLLYHDTQFEIFMWGWVSGNDGKPTEIEYIFVVPSVSTFSDFKLQISENVIFELASFFK